MAWYGTRASMGNKVCDSTASKFDIWGKVGSSSDGCSHPKTTNL